MEQLYNKLIYFLILISSLLSTSVYADNTESCKTSGSYCGIYCLYSAMKFYDVKIEPKQLLKPEYIGSVKGSSLAELKKAAEDNGFFAAPVKNLSTRELLHSPYPVILHVKSAPDKKEYNHYELFLKTKDGQALLYDPPSLLHEVPFYELAPLWDGTGLIVSYKAIDLNAFFAPAKRRYLRYAAIFIAVVLIVKVAQKWIFPVGKISRDGLIRLSIIQSIGLVSVSTLCGMIYHFVNDEGFLAHANAVSAIEQAHTANFIPKISKEKVVRLLANPAGVVFIDARVPADFKKGHLEGAINIPADSNDQQCHKILADVPKNAEIVVYCQSKGCGFANDVASKLIADGFSNVSIFKDGWQEFKMGNQ